MKNIPPAVLGEDELAARAAWLHYAGGLTQSAVAKHLGLPPTRTHRLISRASRDGLVRVFVDCPVESCISLEHTLCTAFGLSHCTVVPDIHDDPVLPLACLSQGGCRFLMRVLENGTHTRIGIGHGRTLGAVVDALPVLPASEVSVVSLLGGLTRKFSANPYDVIFRIAEKTGGDAYFLPAPMYADSVKDRQVMLDQTGIAEVMRRIHSTTLCVLGIGAIEDNEALSLGTGPSSRVGKEEQAELSKQGAVAELLGQFLDAQGQQVSTHYDGCMMAPTLDELSGRDVVGIAGGQHKRSAILAALRSGRLTGLITDEVTARHLVDTGVPAN